MPTIKASLSRKKDVQVDLAYLLCYKTHKSFYKTPFICFRLRPIKLFTLRLIYKIIFPTLELPMPKKRFLC